jgi:hypothetical protein
MVVVVVPYFKIQWWDTCTVRVDRRAEGARDDRGCACGLSP